jgi:hypothetical protein
MAAFLQKWGIPEHEETSPEVTILERLVWVPYKEHWWPALLYKDYTELQDHMYGHLDVVAKAQFASAIMRQLNDRKNCKIARLLGRKVVEVVEVDEKEYAEFYWQLPKVLPMACRKSKYGSDTQLYLDFHRALDEVEEIIRDISENSFNLIPASGKKTWLERAEEALEAPYASSSIDQNGMSMEQKEAEDLEEFNFLFRALDGMMESCNDTYECATGTPEDKIVVADESAPAVQSSPASKTLMEIKRQRETRDSLRKALARQRQLRESSRSSAGSTNCIASDETRDPSTVGNNISLGPTPSTEVQPGISGEDTVLWKALNVRDDPANQPEMAKLSPKNAVVQRGSGRLSNSVGHLIDSREETTEDDREAIIAAARAAAQIELDITFWDHLTCNVME